MIFNGGIKDNFRSHSNGTKNYKIGDTIKNGDLEVKVKSVENTTSVGPSIAPTNAKDTYVVADVSVKNKGNKSLTIDTQMFKLKSGNKSFDADATGSLSANQSDDGSVTNSFFLEQINPDSTAEGKIVFDVSEKVANTKDKKLEITSSLFSVKSITVDLSDAKTSNKDDDESDSDDSESSTDTSSSGSTTPSNNESTSSSSSNASNNSSHSTNSNGNSSSSNNSSNDSQAEKADKSPTTTPKESEPQETKPEVTNNDNAAKPAESTSSSSTSSNSSSDSSNAEK